MIKTDLLHSVRSESITAMSIIATQHISSTTSKPVEYEGYITVNVLKWKNSKYKQFSPYYLRTDGKEECKNDGGILFENFYQGCKVYPTVYENDVYASRFHYGNSKYLWWSFKPVNPKGDVIVDKECNFNKELYLRWRNDLWNANNAVRYPNKFHRSKETLYSLCIDKNGKETMRGYIDARKNLYMKEYNRLIRQTKDYQNLLKLLRDGKKIMICEVDVPANKKKGEYGKNCDENNFCEMTKERIDTLLNDTSAAFGHGLCLAYALFEDLKC